MSGSATHTLTYGKPVGRGKPEGYEKPVGFRNPVGYRDGGAGGLGATKW